jgi:hypothetical protein
VLGLAVVGFVVIRGGDRERETAEPRPAAEPAANKVQLMVMTAPGSAKVTRGGVLLGMTPLIVDVAPGSFALTITKPGYRAIEANVDATTGVTLRKDLQPITGFEGVWALPDGKLRGFWRTTGDKVGIYRLRTLTGDRELWRTGDLVDPPAGTSPSLVVFATDTAMADERSADHSCDDIPHRIEYRFDPTSEALEVRAEIVGTATRDGRCIVVSREPGEPMVLARADRGRGDTHYTQPPVGRPVLSKNGVPNDSLDNAFDVNQKGPSTNAPTKSPAPPTPKSVPKKPTVQAPAPPKKADLAKPVDDQATLDKQAKQAKLDQQAQLDAQQAKTKAIKKAKSPAPPPQANVGAQQANQPAPRGDSQQALPPPQVQGK